MKRQRGKIDLGFFLVGAGISVFLIGLKLLLEG